MTFKFFAIITSAMLIVGCASHTPQTDALLNQPLNVASKTEIVGVPFIDQKVGHCGPATLTMAMNHRGKMITVDEIAPLVYSPNAKGTFQLDMISATRRQGMLAVPVEGLNSLLAEVSGKNPVIVFENLSVSWLPQWHYAIVYGYDTKTQTMTMHSGPEQGKIWDMRKFERSWKLGEYWGFTVLKPGQLAASVGEFEHVKATAGLEQAGKITEAQVSYQAILQKWPTSLGASLGLGNTLFAQKYFGEAVNVLENASQIHPQNSIVWHNLAIAQWAARQEKSARISANQAIRLASNSEQALYRQSLREFIK